MQPIVLRNLKRKAVFLLLLCGMFVAGGIFIATKDESPKGQIIAWSNIVFFGLGMAVAIWLLCDNRPRIVLDDKGIFDRTLAMGLIEWNDIIDAELVQVQRECFVGLLLLDEEKYLERLKPWQRKIADANEFLGFGRVNINLSSVACDPRAVLAEIKKRSAPPPPPSSPHSDD